jgi:selenocysteine lyase/cysteine desulfurase
MRVSTVLLDPSIRSRFAPDTVYLDSATFGLPPDSAVAAMQAGVDRWQRGVATPAEYDHAVDRARELFARLVGVPADHVAIANQVSVLVGTVAASLPDGAHVVAVEDDFASLLFPLYEQAHRDVSVTTVPLEALVDAIDERTDLVAFSLVQSADGRIADLDGVLEAASRHGVRTLVDGTQAAGWLPIDASRIDHLVVGAYKWLLSPRGTAFLTVRPDHLEGLRPVAPGWYAGEDVWGSIYGPRMQLASSARCADVSPAWLCWLGTVPALELILEVGVDRINQHDVALADAVRDGLGLPTSASAIVSIPTRGPVDLARHGISASVRAGSLRVGCHLYNDLSDVEAVVAAVGPEVDPR